MSFILIVAGTALLSLGEYTRAKRGGRRGAILIPGLEIIGILSIIAGAIVLFIQILG